MDRFRQSWLGLLLVVAAAARLTDAPKKTVAAESSPTNGEMVDLARYLDLAEFYVAPPEKKQDPATGCVIGGKNETTLIERLTELNGRKIAELEADMRPGASSTAGFLGPDEKLVEVLTADNRCVVEDLGLTHQELARHLHAQAAVGYWQLKHQESNQPFLYHGRRFKISLTFTRGSQPSPFQDGTQSGANASVENLDNGQELSFALLVPHMIERYGFYEGRGTSYRVDPEKIVGVFDFLKPRRTKP